MASFGQNAINKHDVRGGIIGSLVISSPAGRGRMRRNGFVWSKRDQHRCQRWKNEAGDAVSEELAAHAQGFVRSKRMMLYGAILPLSAHEVSNQIPFYGQKY
jgi:hypothetical protein